MKQKLKKLFFIFTFGLFITCGNNVVNAKNNATISPLPQWNGQNAATYAKNYAKDYNPYYHAFSSDCTNFASQCVLEGKCLMDGDSKNSPKKKGNIVNTSSKWYYLSGGDQNNYVCTTSWCRCSGKNAFANYWDKYNIGCYKKLDNVRKNVSIGDVIQITLKDGTLKHSIIVTKIDKKDIYCASHTADYPQKALTKINKNAKKSWGNVKYTIFHFE